MSRFLIISILVVLVSCKRESGQVVDSSNVDVKTQGGLTYVNGHLYSGIVVETDSGGKNLSSISYVEGKQHGASVHWYSDGTLKERRLFENNKKQGNHVAYWPDGKPAFQATFEEGLYTDTLKEWYTNGQLYRLEFYKLGKQKGRQQAWRKNGELYLNYDVKNGRKYGNTGIKHCKSLWNEVDSNR